MGKIWKYILIGLVGIVLIMALALLYSRSWENALFLNPVHEINSGEKVAALTFDDGPSTNRTPPLLELLAEKEVKATFFMLGQSIERQPEIARQVYEQGHLIGNHSYDHPRMMLRSPGFMRDQIERTDRLIQSLGQKEVRHFRPPGGTKYLILPWLLRSMGKELVTGTYDPLSEYVSPYDGQKVADEVLANVRPGSIIFLHDGKNADAEQFVLSVKLIIEGLREQGYQLVRLDHGN